VDGHEATETAVRDRKLYFLTFLALAMSAVHHIDHIIRGNAVGWPLIEQVNAFTFSLAIYPVIVTGLVLYHLGRVGPGFWAFLSGGGALFVAAIHLGPQAVEPPTMILDHYHEPAVGVLAFGWLIAFIAVLVVTFGYELRQWLRQRRVSSTAGEHRAGTG
jgi:predicted membrane channel-forming protein YqfA (hemolysin III family)